MRRFSLFIICFNVLILNAQKDSSFIADYNYKQIETNDQIINYYKLSAEDWISVHQTFSKKTNRLLAQNSYWQLMRHGIQTQFYESGNLKYMISYYNDYPNGTEVGFYENGNIKAIYDWGTVEESIRMKSFIKNELDKTKNLDYDKITGELIGDTIVFLPRKGQCIEYFENGCVKRVFVYENGICSYVLLYDENEFFIKKEQCEYDQSSCDFGESVYD